MIIIKLKDSTELSKKQQTELKHVGVKDCGTAVGRKIVVDSILRKRTGGQPSDLEGPEIVCDSTERYNSGKRFFLLLPERFPGLELRCIYIFL